MLLTSSSIILISSVLQTVTLDLMISSATTMTWGLEGNCRMMVVTKSLNR